MTNKTIIHTEQAPRAIGTYSQAVRVDKTVYLSGQIALDPHTMTMVNDTIEQEIRQVLTNLSAVCVAAGGSLAEIVKLQVYLTDLAHFASVNSLMAEFMQAPYPARAAIGVAQLPRGARVEMDGVLVVG
ncbi:MAG: reactive intermediate/imine deaminase [Halothiobacillus sp. 24-54-40]|jgi:reactive intermediate/imine deaminase|nr:RidA family protein [Halothiobacillaceae bacterium]OYV46449.1 MAG: reactive intermediate/imine deaminase [Halothiobacillus sp. 20-53-49]OYY38900.1 MAG: reactive intermediate/imine deaminase [Halothiobacillus sp. 35-54-62]OYY57165.1 MAG: reactive intermediate/imine deaminase [Halothiobacillus sp. 28-55-5]OYZ86683.1 MAG: reactive intermediate/imine deaminase [Halothiobacillus sp. 24-54-40]OZA80570.1 MAG: reactive intermediate/imine deaminase [Halothiobacillus sp. 39-53-45]HQS02561.1 Rid fami